MEVVDMERSTTTSALFLGSFDESERKSRTCARLSRERTIARQQACWLAVKECTIRHCRCGRAVAVTHYARHFAASRVEASDVVSIRCWRVRTRL